MTNVRELGYDVMISLAEGAPIFLETQRSIEKMGEALADCQTRLQGLGMLPESMRGSITRFAAALAECASAFRRAGTIATQTGPKIEKLLVALNKGE